MELTDRSCPKCNFKGKPEIVVNGEVILAICPKYNAVQNNLPGYKIDPGAKTIIEFDGSINEGLKASGVHVVARVAKNNLRVKSTTIRKFRFNS